jgi:hypothetical protein
LKARFIVEGEDGTKKIPVGTVIDDPRAFRLVQNGMATPEDDECRARSGMTDEQMLAAQEARKRMVTPGVQEYQKNG